VTSHVQKTTKGEGGRGEGFNKTVFKGWQITKLRQTCAKFRKVERDGGRLGGTLHSPNTYLTRGNEGKKREKWEIRNTERKR